MSDESSAASGVVSFFSDPTTLVTLGAIAAGAALYLSTRPQPFSPPIPVDNQSLEQPGGEHVRLSHLVKDGKLITTRFDDAKTLYEVFQRGMRVSNDGPCLGKRSGPGTPYEWVSYSHVVGRAKEFGAGLATLGIEPGQDSYVGVYSQNGIDWVVTEQSCNMYSRVLVPLYDTLGPESVSYILNQATVTVVVCHESKVAPLMRQKTSALRLVVSMGASLSQEAQDLATSTGIALHTMAQVEQLGRDNPVDIMPATPDDLATICYTSGTTGAPKGAMITNGNIVSNLSAAYAALEVYSSVTPNDIHISYLPLAHMFERVVQGFMLMCGGQIGFFQGDVKQLVDDIHELRPTIFVSVPRLLNRVYDKVVAGASSSAIKKWLFEKALASKIAEVKRGIIRRDSIWDKLVFHRVQESMGGRVKFIVTGSAPISGRVLDFLRAAFGCQVYEGYGQTEGTAGTCFTLPGDFSTGHVGPPLPCNAIKLVDVEDMNYFADNQEGEVCFKGPNVFKGYLKDPKKTAETIDQDGWLHSGDIGKWLPNGALKIIDRKKHIFKLAQGEYIAPEKIENIYVRSKFVAQAYLHGDSLKHACVAVIVPDEEVLSAWAIENSISGTFKDLCANEAIKKMTLVDITREGKEGGLHSFEQAKAIVLYPDPFSVENSLLTPTFKLKRPILKKHFAETFVQLYDQLPS